MAAPNIIKEFVEIKTPLLDKWLEHCTEIKAYAKAHALYREQFSNLPHYQDLQDELTLAFNELREARLASLQEEEDSASIITMECQDWALKTLIAASQACSHDFWRGEDDQQQ
jgi:hypothetical protein